MQNRLGKKTKIAVLALVMLFVVLVLCLIAPAVDTTNLIGAVLAAVSAVLTTEYLSAS